MDTSRMVSSAKNDKNEIIATVTDYYDRFVHKLGDKYQKSSFTKDKLVLCPFHADVNPSMGLIKDKIDKKIEIFHCFGCGAGGDVVKFHRRFVNLTEQRNISLETASKEVARIYGITIDESKVEDELKNLLGAKEIEVEKNLGVYNFRSHSANLLKLRMVQEEMSLQDLAVNLDVLLNKWKLSVGGESKQ